MRIVRHPLVDQDLEALVDHIVDVTGGDFGAADRRLDEVDDLIADISANPMSGVRLAPPLEGWLVRHGGRGHRLTVVFRADLEEKLRLCRTRCLRWAGLDDRRRDKELLQRVTEARRGRKGVCDSSTLRLQSHDARF